MSTPTDPGARLGAELSDAIVMFHEALGALTGLSAADNKALGVIRREGPMSARELADRTGLTAGAVTGLVDRLEHAGYARRTRHETDRRRLVIEATAPASPQVNEAVAEMAQAMGRVTGQFTADELLVVARWVELTTATMREQAARTAARTA
ncbi:MarR family transcriptional regulator [Promicromonospora sukumoe]|uniref:DNA-binding MarR family transcriptional regulator n=1 Tax=Promicromonospora sukumoe TaxID=88382 RepID=A0A7W3JCV5_9MICO|nr:MarR family transcriptional regulator [Promicromonospora sukumoe]MBA8810505.1 DNA-binding MarR family transcriptional regulator [Promicromonospora sukumoe]